MGKVTDNTNTQTFNRERFKKKVDELSSNYENYLSNKKTGPQSKSSSDKENGTKLLGAGQGTAIETEDEYYQRLYGGAD